VTSVQDGSQRVATVTLDSTHLADVLMREGVKAWVLDSGGIEFDVSGVAEGAKALPSGSRIVAERRNAVETAVQRWATGGNIVVIGVGLLARLVVLSIAKALLRGAAVIARLVVACGLAAGVAYLAAPPLAPFIERELYPLLESARTDASSSAGASADGAAAPQTSGEAQPEAGATGSAVGIAQTSPPASTPNVGLDAKRARLDELANAAKQRLGEWGRQTTEALRNRPLPNPIYPAFFGAWLVSFVVLAGLLRKVMREG
jgi:hypothetical protein